MKLHLAHVRASRDVTTDYSAAELSSLIEAANRVIRSKDSPSLTVLRLAA